MKRKVTIEDIAGERRLQDFLEIMG